MKYQDNGAYFSVIIEEDDIQRFARRWPCLEQDSEMWAQFEKSNGNLVDLEGDDNGADGSGISALLDAARDQAAYKLGIKKTW